jgi:hypothetical protein
MKKATQNTKTHKSNTVFSILFSLFNLNDDVVLADGWHLRV